MLVEIMVFNDGDGKSAEKIEYRGVDKDGGWTYVRCCMVDKSGEKCFTGIFREYLHTDCKGHEKFIQPPVRKPPKTRGSRAAVEADLRFDPPGMRRGWPGNDAAP